MSLDLPQLIETAADEVASVGRAAAGSINELVHDWGHETRSFVSEHAPSLPAVRGRHRRRDASPLRLLIPIAVLGVVAFVMLRRRRRATPHLPERETTQAHVHETVTPSKDDRTAQGAAAS